MFKSSAHDMTWPPLLVLLITLLHLSESKWLNKREVPQKIPNIGTSWKSFVARSLPNINGKTDTQYIPYVGNGYLAYTPYTDYIYTEGLYSGEGSQSHLAAIPAFAAFTIKPENTGALGASLGLKKLYSLNVEKGYFEEKLDVNSLQCSASLRIYAHADPKLNNVLIQEVYMQRHAGATKQEDVIFEPVFLNPAQSGDVTLKCEYIRGVSREKNCSGTISQTESPSVRPASVFTFYTYPNMIMLRADQNSAIYQSIIVVDSNLKRAEQNFALAKSLKANKELANRHTNHWRNRWRRFSVAIDGNKELNDLAYGSLYQLSSALPQSSEHDFQGFAHVGTSSGHVTSNNDVWTFPVALVFSPDIARALLQYRTDRLPAARDLAKSNAAKGAKFPWESAQTGHDVTPANCGICRSTETKECNACKDLARFADHVTSDVAMAGRLYVSATDDRNWLQNHDGLNLLKETAEYFVSRAYRDAKGRYNLYGVMGPDIYEWRSESRKVDNDIYTNIGASLAIQYARYAACLMGEKDSVPDKWLDIAGRMSYPVAFAEKYFNPFDRYDMKKKLYLPGPLMVDFPLAFNISQKYRRNNLERYQDKLIDNPPVFAYAAIVMSWLSLYDTEKASQAIVKMTEYSKGPFSVWADSATDKFRATSYVPGAAAFLSTLLFGYGGIRILSDRMDINPQCPPQAKGVTFNGITYMDAKFRIQVYKCDTDKPVVKVTMTESRRDLMFRLKLQNTGEENDFLQDNPKIFPRGLVSIYPARTDSCSLPNPPVHGSTFSAAPSISRCSLLTLSSTSVLLNILLGLCLVGNRF